MNNTTNTKKGTDGQTQRRQKRFAIAEALGDLESNLSLKNYLLYKLQCFTRISTTEKCGI